MNHRLIGDAEQIDGHANPQHEPHDEKMMKSLWGKWEHFEPTGGAT